MPVLRSEALQRRHREVSEDPLPAVAGGVPWAIIERAMPPTLRQVGGEALNRGDRAVAQGPLPQPRREHWSAHGHALGAIGALQIDDVFVAAAQPAVDIARLQDRDHRLRVDRRDLLVRGGGHRREAADGGSMLPKARKAKMGWWPYAEQPLTLQQGLCELLGSH